jgi:hypothetical protein
VSPRTVAGGLMEGKENRLFSLLTGGLPATGLLPPHHTFGLKVLLAGNLPLDWVLLESGASQECQKGLSLMAHTTRRR